MKKITFTLTMPHHLFPIFEKMVDQQVPTAVLKSEIKEIGGDITTIQYSARTATSADQSTLAAIAGQVAGMAERQVAAAG